MRYVLALALLGCTSANPGFATGVSGDAGAAADMAHGTGGGDGGAIADMTEARDMTIAPGTDMLMCTMTGGPCSSSATTCCQGLCSIAIDPSSAPSSCTSCGVAGQPCCDGPTLMHVCEASIAGQRSFCDYGGNTVGTCDACGKTGQDCCTGKSCDSTGDACTTCDPTRDNGSLTRCEPNNCGSVGHSCCYMWPAVCGSGPPARVCFGGATCVMNGNDPTGWSCQ